MTDLDRIIADYTKVNSSNKPHKSKDASEQRKQNRQNNKGINNLLKALTQSKSKKRPSPRSKIQMSITNYTPPSFNQRVIIKATYKTITNRAEARKSLKSHMSYIMREGTGNSPPFAPDEKSMKNDSVTHFLNDENERTFRFIISPENAKMFKSDSEFKSYISDVMMQMSHDIQIPNLNWMAVNHFNTDNPHTHVLLKGISKEGKEVRIPKEYLKNSFRKVAEEIATNYLGARTVEDLQEARNAEVDAERFTSIDSKIILACVDGVFEFEPSFQVSSNIGKNDNLLINKRLMTLTRLGFAKPFGKMHFAISPQLKEKLQAMPLEKDIIKRLAVLSKKYTIDKNTHFAHAANAEPIVGTVIDKGYYEESTESKYIIVLGTDRKTHYVKLTKISEVSGNESGIGDLVKIASKITKSNTDQKEYQSIILDKISCMPLVDQIDYNGVTYLDRVIASKSHLVENPNNYQTELIDAVEKRTQYLKDLGKLFEINGELKFKKNYWTDSEVLEHSRVSNDFQQKYRFMQEGEVFTGKMIDTKVFQDGAYAVISDGKEFVTIPLKAKMLDHLNSGLKVVVTKLKERRGYSAALFSVKTVQVTKIVKENVVNPVI